MLNGFSVSAKFRWRTLVSSLNITDVKLGATCDHHFGVCLDTYFCCYVVNNVAMLLLKKQILILDVDILDIWQSLELSQVFLIKWY